MPSFWQRMRAAIAPRTLMAPTVAPFFNVVEETEDSPAEVYYFGDVVEEVPYDWWTGKPIEGQYITLDQVMNDLERVRDASEITIHLNSSGGDLFAGIAIHNLISSFAGHKTVIVDGLAASAASIIMCAGDTVKVHPGSMVMIHNVASFLCGYYPTTELRDVLVSHEAAERSLVRIYQAKTGKDESELQTLIDATTWYVGQDAIDEGFADELVSSADEAVDDPDEQREIEPTVSADGRYLMVAGIPHLITNLGELPPWLVNKPGISDVAAATHGYRHVDDATALVASEPEKEGDMDITNAADLRDAYPDLVAAIEHDAASAERNRIREINEIAANIRNPQLVNRAMFEAPMSAAELALESVKVDSARASSFLADLEADAQNATDDDEQVKPSPAEDEDDDTDEQREKQEVAAMVDLYNTMKGRRA